MCGMQEINFDDLRQHAQVRGHNQRFLRVVDWFWAVVAEFSQEELARLVQFVTGSSQLPPGGFKELRPSLPYSCQWRHTQQTAVRPYMVSGNWKTLSRTSSSRCCSFNHICLPEYHSFEQFRRSLMTAINEGCEGVLLEWHVTFIVLVNYKQRHTIQYFENLCTFIKPKLCITRHSLFI